MAQINKSILVLCTGNSCRSQIMHGFLANYLPNSTVYSAGIETHGVNPLAIKVMAEKGIDLSNHTSNHIDEYLHLPLDVMISVCDHAAESCPVVPLSIERIHQSFEDPAKVKGTEEEILQSFRKVRDEIDVFCREFAAKN